MNTGLASETEKEELLGDIQTVGNTILSFRSTIILLRLYIKLMGESLLILGQQVNNDFSDIFDAEGLSAATELYADTEFLGNNPPYLINYFAYDHRSLKQLMKDMIGGELIKGLGASGGSSTSTGDTSGGFIFVQNVPSIQWIIPHSLNTFPTVILVDFGGQRIEGDVEYVSTTRINVYFSEPVAGRAIIGTGTGI